MPLSRYTVFLQNCPLGHDPKDLDFLAGALGLEPRTNGFGDRDSTN